MATNKKAKSGKDNDRKSSRKSEESSPTEEKCVESPFESATEVEEGMTVEEASAEQPCARPQHEEEQVYEEPVLVKLVVNNYIGEKVAGLYEGEGKAEFNGGHHYEGHFSEGMMHGIGTYTWADGLVYEGEFVKNHVMGKGSYKWPDGSTYDGEVVDGKRDGFGTFTSADKRICYSGQWSKGKAHGKGRMNYNADGTAFYDGEWHENVRHGWGTHQFQSGNIYQGMWFNNKRHGEGTMRWVDTNQMYTGMWEDGMQSGCGQHIWFLNRVAGSQYPLRNMYDGEFVQGLRHGLGTFYYANGARYEGEWLNNMKHGKGKFVFKNGRIYEGTFERDHIVEFPNFVMDGVNTPDLTQIRTCTPLASEHLSLASNESRNTYGPSLQLELAPLLAELADADPEEEASQVKYVVLRHTSSLRKVYAFYSQLGFEDSPDNTFIMSRLQLWRFLKDCKLHHNDTTPMEMDRIISGVSWSAAEDIHNPATKILFREFLNYLIMLAYHVYQDCLTDSSPVLSICLSKLITDNILHHACCLKGSIFIEPRRSANVLMHMDQAYEVYRSFCTFRKVPPKEPSMKMRQFLHMLKDLNLLNDDLTAKAVVDILAADDPNVTDIEGTINLELEMTFLEYFEALVLCAQVFVTEAVVKDPVTPQLSGGPIHDPMSQVQSMSPSRIDSQVDGQVSEGQSTVTPGVQALSSRDNSPLPPEASSSTQKGTNVAKPEMSSLRVGSQAEDGVNSDCRKSAVSLGGAKSGQSHQSGASLMSDNVPLAHSTVSLDPTDPTQEEHAVSGEGEEEEDEEVLDEDTCQYNFWTHQVHIFFVVKFFPAAQQFVVLRQLAKQKIAVERSQANAPILVEKPQENPEEVSSNSVKTEPKSTEIGVNA